MADENSLTEDITQDTEAPQVEETTEQPPETPPESGVSASEVEETDEQQFERLMAERAAKREGRPPEPTTEPEPEEPEPERAEKAAEPGKPPEWFETLPDDAKQQIQSQVQQTQKLYQDYQALHGRLAPMQRQNEDLRKQVDDLKAQLQKAEQEPPTPPDLEKNDAFNEFEADWPEEAKQIKAAIAARARAAEQAQEQARQTQAALQAERRRWIGRETQRLAEKHQDWMQVINTPEFQQWRTVIQANPQLYPDLAPKFSSMYAEDNIALIDRFKADLAEIRQPKAQTQPPSRRPPPNPAPASSGSGVSGAQRRTTPMTDEEAFAAYLASKRS